MRNGTGPYDPTQPPQTATTIGGRTPEPGRDVPNPREVRITGRFVSRPTRQVPDADEVPKNYLVSSEVQITASPELPHALDFSTATHVQFRAPSIGSCVLTYSRLIMNDVRRVTFGYGGNDNGAETGCRDFTGAVSSSGLSMTLKNVKLHVSGAVIETVYLDLY